MQLLWTILILIPVLFWSSPEIVLFGYHLFFTDNSLRVLITIIFFSLVSVYGFVNIKSFTLFNNNLFLISLIFIQLTYAGYFFLSLTTSLISFTFTLELINLIVMTLLITTLTTSYKIHARVHSNNSLIVFFLD